MTVGIVLIRVFTGILRTLVVRFSAITDRGVFVRGFGSESILGGALKGGQ